jgi:hypothetical protein
MKWIYIGTTDYLEHLDHEGVKNKEILLGFTINLLALGENAQDPYTPLSDDVARSLVTPDLVTLAQMPPEVVPPELKLPEVNQEVPFIGWSFKVEGGVAGALVPLQDFSLVKSDLGAVNKALGAAITPMREALLKTVPHVHGGKDETLDPHTLSSMVAGMSQKGFPAAHALNLAFWLRADAVVPPLPSQEELPGVLPASADGTFVVVTPLLKGFKPPTPKHEGGEGITFEYVSTQPEGAGEVTRTFLTKPARIEPERKETFIGTAMKLYASEMINWRKDFGGRAGEFLDVFHISHRLCTWPDDPHEDVADEKEFSERLDWLSVFLALAHDVADNGLRVPLSAYPFDGQPEFPFAGSLAWEIARAWSMDQNGNLDDEGLEAEIERQVKKLIKWMGNEIEGLSKPVGLGWPWDGGDTNWLSMLAQVFHDLDGDNPSNYPNLRNALLEAGHLRKLLGLPEGAPRNPWTLREAVREISLMLEDDEMLRRLFIQQVWVPWGLGAETDPKGRVSKLRGVIDDWCTKQGRSFSKAYHDGLAAALLIPLRDADLADRGSEADNAKFLLRLMLNKYCDERVKKAGLFAYSLMPPGDEFHGLIPTPEMIEQMVNDGYTGDTTVRGKDVAWHVRLLGTDRSREPVGSPPPLLVPGPVMKKAGKRSYDPERSSGVLLFCRRRKWNTEQWNDETDKPFFETPWYLATVGDLVVHLDDPARGQPAPVTLPLVPPEQDGSVNPDSMLLDDVANSTPKPQDSEDHCHLVPAPQPIGEAQLFKLPGSSVIMEFVGAPLGVLLWKEHHNWLADSSDAIVYQDATSDKVDTTVPRPARRDRMLHRQILSAQEKYQGHGLVPGLLYDKKLSYEFLFSPVHNTGALPKLLRENIEMPGSLASRTAINTKINEMRYSELPVVVVKLYLRRVPVGAPRLLEGVQLGGQVNGKPVLDHYDDKRMPTVPAGVVPIAIDIRPVYAVDYVESLRDPPVAGVEEKPLDVPPPPPQVLLLHQGTGSDVLRLQLCPPATDVMNWAIWMASLNQENTGAKRAEVADFIADVERMVREKRLEMDEKVEGHLSKEQISSLIDDPAVEGLYIRQRVLFNQDMSEPNQATYTRVAFMKCGVHPTVGVADDPGINQKIDKDGVALLRNSLRSRFEHGGKKTLVIRHADADYKPEADDLVSVIMPIRQVWELEIIPCVKKSVWNARFGLYAEGESKNPLGIFECPPIRKLAGIHEEGEDWLGVMSGVVRLWVESVPRVSAQSQTDPLARISYMPDAEEVWHSLRLGAVGTFTARAPKVELLEVVVQPGVPGKTEDLRVKRRGMSVEVTEKVISVPFDWVFVSGVQAFWQRWYWRGMPEGTGEEWDRAPLLPPYRTETPPADANAAEIVTLRALEAPSWAERRPGDGEKSPLGTVNLASWWVCRKASPEPPAAQVNESESGEPLDRPEHILGRLRLWSRYRGLSGHEAPVDGVIQVSGVTSPEHEHHRRLTLRGKLKTDKIHPPLVKMVLPLFGAPNKPALLPKMEKVKDGENKDNVPKDKGKAKTGETKSLPDVASRPGFLVILLEPLASPFHHLTAEVEWARLEDTDEQGQKRVRTLPELAPDPITAPDSFDWNFRDRATMRMQSRQEGYACGLTHEREADSQLFPNSAFMFKAPVELAYSSVQEAGKEPAENWRHDWFVKVRFRWEISPARVMLDDPKYLTGEQSGAWQVRLLAPTKTPQLWMLKNETPELHLTDETEVEVKVTSATVNCRTVKGQRELLPNTGDSPLSEMDDEEPVHAYLLAVWSLVPDVLNSEPSKTAHSLYLYTPPASPKDQADKNENSCLKVYQPSNTLQAHGANLLRIFTRVKALRTLMVKLDAAQKNSAKKGAALSDLMDWLFPDAQTDIESPLRNWQDAGGIIDRCSEALPCT